MRQQTEKMTRLRYNYKFQQNKLDEMIRECNKSDELDVDVTIEIEPMDLQSELNNHVANFFKDRYK